MQRVREYLKIMRIPHYLKNMLIFLPLIFDQQLFNWSLLFKVLLGFIAYSFIASSIYIINDICDIESDRNHIRKRYRPLASGKINILNARALSGALLVLSLIINYFTYANLLLSYTILAVYGLLNVLYSTRLKSLPILDVLVLASGYVLRVIYGGVISGTSLSNWLILTVIAVALYLGFGKRRNEFVKQGQNCRAVLKFYNLRFLDKHMYIYCTLAIVFYSLWTIDYKTIERISGMVWTIPIFMTILMRYSLIIEGDSFGDPVDVLLSDKVLILLVSLFVGVFLGMIYLRPIVLR